MTTIDRPRATSGARIKANRENARKSTGPRTPEGKAAASRNAFKHGLCSETHLLGGEDPEEFLMLLKDLYDRFRPIGASEEALVKRMAAALWRLDRVPDMEAGILRGHFYDALLKERANLIHYRRITHWSKEDDKPEPSAPTPIQRDLPGRAFTIDCENAGAITRLSRYETTLARSIDLCLHQLKAFQAARISAERDPACASRVPSIRRISEACETNPIAPPEFHPAPPPTAGPIPINGKTSPAPKPPHV